MDEVFIYWIANAFHLRDPKCISVLVLLTLNFFSLLIERLLIVSGSHVYLSFYLCSPQTLKSMLVILNLTYFNLKIGMVCSIHYNESVLFIQDCILSNFITVILVL